MKTHENLGTGDMGIHSWIKRHEEQRQREPSQTGDSKESDVNLKALTIAVVLAMAPAVSMAAELPELPTLATVGYGVIDAKPNMATLSIEVNQTAPTAAKAKALADEKVAAYFSFLEKNGVATKDINAANLQTQPEYEYVKDQSPKIIGYRAIRNVEVKLMDLSKLNTLMDGALKAGLNDIQGIQMGVSDPAAYQQQAREAAINDAQSKAKSVASGFGVKLGEVYRIRYDTNPQPRPMPPMLRMAAFAAPDNAKVNETYQQQNLHFTDQVDVVYTLNK